MMTAAVRPPPPIRRRLMQLVLACVLPLTVVAGLLGVHDYRLAREQLMEATRGTVRALALAIDAEVAQPRLALSTLAGARLLQSGRLREFHAQMREVEPALEMAGLFLLGADGRLLLHTHRPPGEALPAMPPQVVAALGATRPFLTPLITDPVSGRAGVAILVPLASGLPAAALGAWLPPQRLGKMLTREDFPASWTVAVFDTSGTVLARSHAPDATVGRPGPASLLARMGQAPEGLVDSVTLEGVDVTTAFSRAPVAGWHVAVGVPRAELVVPLRERALLLVLAAFMVLAGTLGLAWRMGDRIVESIHALREPSAALARGEVVELPRLSFLEAQRLGAFLQESSQRQQAAHAELRRSHDALVRSNLDLQQYAFVASHDLRGPLNTISSYLDLMRRKHADQIPHGALALLDRVSAAVQQLDALTTALLSYASIESKARPFAEVSMDEVLRDCEAALEASLREAGARVTHDPLPVVWGERTQLAQLMQNLIGNAVKYRSAAPPEIQVRAERHGHAWLFSVRDNGIGIEPRHQKRIFEIFKRLHGQHEIPGTGIGLSICKRVVHAHGGELWVESQAGEGSTFRFTVADKENTG